MLHHQLWEGASGLWDYSQLALAHLLQELLESGDIVSDELSIKKGRDRAPSHG